MSKIGVKTENIKSGKLKDMLSPTVPLSDEARAVMQGIVMDVYNQFVDAVALGRQGKLTRAEVLKLADGRIYSGTQAKQLKLIDELGSMEDAVRGTAAARRIAGKHRIRRLLPARPAKATLREPVLGQQHAHDREHEH